MSSSKQNFRKPKHSSDPSFNLDNYLEEKGAGVQDSIDYENERKEKNPIFKNGILVLAVILSGMLWYNDWSPKAMYQSLFGGPEVEVISGAPVVIEIPPINVDIPEINIPDIDFGSNAENLGSVIEYLQELQNLNLLDNKISAFDARQVYNAGVPINYLIELDRRGLLGVLSFVEISEFYKNQVPFEYLQAVKDRGYEGRLSFVEISEYYKNDVSFDYLDTMDEAGYLDELSFVHITEYYKNGITPEFLDELKQTGLYNSLNFIDVVEIYKSQN